MRRFSFFILFVLIFAMALPGCRSNGGNGHDEPKVQLGGKIYKQGTKELITSEVAVSIDNKQITTTNGEYQFTGLTTGNKTLQASAPGYKAYTATVTVEPGENTHDIYMEEQGQAPSISLRGKIINEEQRNWSQVVLLLLLTVRQL